MPQKLIEKLPFTGFTVLVDPAEGYPPVIARLLSFPISLFLFLDLLARPKHL
jgi:hypothetical protein